MLIWESPVASISTLESGKDKMLRAHQKYIFYALSSLPIRMAGAFVSRPGCGLILIHKTCNNLCMHYSLG